MAGGFTHMHVWTAWTLCQTGKMTEGVTLGQSGQLEDKGGKGVSWWQSLNLNPSKIGGIWLRRPAGD